MMDGIAKVVQRINDIQQKFGLISTQDMNENSFQEVLAKTVKQNLAANQAQDVSYYFTKPSVSKSGSAAGNVSSNEIINLLQTSAQKYGVNSKLVMAIAQTESNFSPTAVSPVGAVGVMQLMPDTARMLGVRNINDPRENIDGGVKYIKNLLNMFNGDVVKAVAAYNAGPNAVKEYNGVPPYSETRDYVSRVLSLV